MENNKMLPINNKPADISFNKEVVSLEFIELIGNMDIECCVNQNKRNEYLLKHGEKLLKKHTNKKKRHEIKISMDNEIRLWTQDEIDSLLRGKNEV